MFDRKFLTFLGNRIGKTLKVDIITSKQSRGRYVKIYIEVDSTKSLLLEYSIKGKTYHTEYESLHLIFFNYGKYGHYSEFCPDKPRQSKVDIRVEKNGDESMG